MSILQLPHWQLTNPTPSFYDVESGTFIEMISKVYGKTNELVIDYNNFTDNVSKIINDFVASEEKDNEAFQVGLRQEFQNFINVIDLKVLSIDKEVSDLVTNLREDVMNEMRSEIEKALNNQNLTVTTKYDETTERLDFVFAKDGV